MCKTCAKLHITCHYDHDKPEWMDGGARQTEMAERLRQEVKENAHRRREERALLGSSEGLSGLEAAKPQMTMPPPSFAHSETSDIARVIPIAVEEPCRGVSSNERQSKGDECTLITKVTGMMIVHRAGGGNGVGGLTISFALRAAILLRQKSVSQ